MRPDGAGAGKGKHRHAGVEAWASGSGGDKAESPLLYVACLYCRFPTASMELQDYFLGLLSILLPGGEGITLNSFSSGPAASPSASVQVADKVIFSESKTDPVLLSLELCYFFPLVLKLEIYFLFLFTAGKASCDLGFTGSLTAPHLRAIFSQPGCFLLCYLWGVPLPRALCALCLLCRKHCFFSDLPWFQSYTHLRDYHLMPASLTVL